MVKLTTEKKSLCILEIYPPQIKKEEEIDDGWLSYEGWEQFTKLRKILSENIEFRKQV